MQATLNLPLARNFSATPSAKAEPAHPTSAGLQESSVDSINLLRGNKSIAIVHNGAVYRLQSTKLGKLILTK